MQVFGTSHSKVGEDKRECIKATLLEQDRLLHDIEEGSLLDLGTTTPKQVDVLECRTTDVPVSIVKSKERNSPPEESIEDLTSALIEEIVTSHRLEVHLDRVSYKLRAAHSAIVRQAKNLLNEVTTTLTYAKQMDCPPTEKIEEYFNRAEEINHAVFQLTAVAVRKASDLRTVSSDSSSGLDVTRSSAIVDARLAKQPWTTCIGGGGGAALTLLSDIYLSIKAMEQGGQDAEEVWVAPQAFERATQKYWVKEENLTEVLLSCVAKVPLLVYGKSGRLHEESEDVESDVDLWETHVATISSVYFDSPSLDLYKGRIARIEGAKLVRVRWYGAQPRGHGIVFLELKTHHESWVDEKSSKQRVSVQEKDMLHIMSSSKLWTVDFAESIVRSGNTNLDKKGVRDATSLLIQIHELIVELDLRPCVRTCYRRAAFQASTSNELRLTIDRDIVMIDERHAPRGAWCLPNQAAVKLAPTTRVPVAVFEVKLAGCEMPAFMEHLTQSNAVRDGYKFSKFLTGVATFHPDSENLAVLPYWADDPIFAHIFHIDRPTVENRDQTDRASAPKYVEEKSSESTLSTFADISETEISESHNSRSSWKTYIRRSKKPKRMATSNRVKIEPKTYFAAERTFIQWISAALMLITVAAILLSFSKAEGMQSGFVAGIILTVLAVLVTMYALAVYYRRIHLLEKGLPYGYIDHMGPAVLAVAVAAGIAAAIYVAAYNHKSLEMSTAALVAEPGCCVEHGFKGISLLEYQPSDVVVDELKNLLIIPSQSKITSIPLEINDTPPDVKVLVEVPGVDMESVALVNGRLFALSEDKDMSILLAFDLKTNIFNKAEEFQLVGRWKLKGAENAEGLVYFPDLGGTGGKLLVSAEGASTADSVQSNIFVFKIPEVSSVIVADDMNVSENTIPPLYQLNAGIFTNGLVADMKISAMTYFEGILYVLHDNARVIRGWDIATATMVAELSTPRAGGHYDKQWEGLTLQRAGDFSIVAHMTLDTPPQIWSFVMVQSLKEGKTTFAFPDCAQAY